MLVLQLQGRPASRIQRSSPTPFSQSRTLSTGSLNCCKLKLCWWRKSACHIEHLSPTPFSQSRTLSTSSLNCCKLKLCW